LLEAFSNKPTKHHYRVAFFSHIDITPQAIWI